MVPEGAARRVLGPPAAVGQSIFWSRISAFPEWGQKRIVIQYAKNVYRLFVGSPCLSSVRRVGTIGTLRLTLTLFFSPRLAFWANGFLRFGFLVCAF